MPQLSYALGPRKLCSRSRGEIATALRPLHLKGPINGKTISRMLVDGGATVNLMPYTIFKKLGKADDELTTQRVHWGFH